VLYAGRKDASKNVPALVEAFAAWRVKARREVDLVLIGPGAVPIPAAARGAVRDLGYVPLQDKRDAYAAATVFCQPSLNESFSIVMMEAWSRGVPCLVHGGCVVTRDHVVDAGGGLWFTDAAGFGAALEYLLDRPALCARLGAAGRDYALGRYTWDRIIARYMADVL
jgi:glycosyltransferase involved in cell wall biosynthesis